MQKLRHRMFSDSLSRTKTCLILPHVLQPCIKVVRDSTDLLFPKNSDQCWHPTTDIDYFKKDEIAMRNNAEHCLYINSLVKAASQFANAGQGVKACSLLAELITNCDEKNKILNEDKAGLVEGWRNGTDGDGGMGYIAAMIGLNDQMIPNDLAIMSAQIYRTLINKDYQSFLELQPTLIESLDTHLEVYIAASEHYDEQFIAKLLSCLVDILHYNTYLNNNILAESIKTLISRIHCTYPMDSRLFWSQLAFKFHYVFYCYQANLHKNALDQLKDLEGNLFSLQFSTDKHLSEKSKQLLQGAYIYNKCQLANLGYTEENELLDYAKNLLSQALDNKDDLLREIFSAQEHSLRVLQ